MSTEDLSGDFETESKVDEISTPLPPLTPVQWERVLGGDPYRVLVNADQIEWAGERAVRCITCTHAPGESHDPWYAWCIAPRTLVSNTFAKLCPSYERRVD